MKRPVYFVNPRRIHGITIDLKKDRGVSEFRLGGIALQRVAILSQGNRPPVFSMEEVVLPDIDAFMGLEADGQETLQIPEDRLRIFRVQPV